MAKALTIKQPWAWAIIYAGKNVENRTKQTWHRGPLFIHASADDSLEGWQFLDEHDFRLPIDPPVSGIIGIVDVVDCVEGYDSVWAMPGYRHWVLANPEPVPFVPMKGALFMFNPLERTESRKEAKWLEEALRARSTKRPDSRQRDERSVPAKRRGAGKTSS